MLISRHQGLRYPYAEFDDAVDRVARALLHLGLERGDRRGIWSPNRAEWALVQYATAKVGVILVTINPAYRTFLAGAQDVDDATRRERAATLDPSDPIDIQYTSGTTVLHGAPTMFIAEFEHPEFGRFDLTSLRSGIMATSSTAPPPSVACARTSRPASPIRTPAARCRGASRGSSRPAATA